MRTAVFCGSSMGCPEHFAVAAADFGCGLARAGVGIVYGGASVGLMGVLADAALAEGGEVIGVIPGGLFAAEVPHPGLTRLDVVSSMHERKAVMASLADGFAALPGGLGTLDELFEILTWRQIGLHAKPVALVDVGGFWDPMDSLLDGLAAAGFVSEVISDLLPRVRDAQEFLRLFA
jgi:uncharacterized protein (TIGR00730 family)